LVTPDKGAQHLGPLKTPESYREVPLAPSTVEALSAHMAEFPPVGQQLEDRTDPLNPKGRAVRQPTLHGLRDFYASVLLEAGESIKAVSEYLGHTDPALTLRIYAHLMPSSRERTRKAIDRVLRTGPEDA